MMTRSFLRHLLPGFLTAFLLGAATLATPLVMAALTPAQAQVSAEFEAALEPYGHWVRLARWGEVWQPDDVPPDWRPYSYGHWVYTDEWGWYWVSDEQEEDWGWVVFHYGRWIHDRGAWFWMPGDEWAPAWVDWREGDDYIGWAPAPPDDAIYEYDDEPTYWVFVAPRYLVAPRWRTYMLPSVRSRSVFRRTVVINRTVVIEHDHDGRRRIAVSAGISQDIVAAARRRPVETFRVRPHVLSGTIGVVGAVTVRPQDLAGRPRGARTPNRALAPVVQRTSTAIQPAKSVPKPTPLGKNERGRLGAQPPRAAQGGTLAPPAPPTPPRQQQHVAPPPQHAAPPPQVKPQPRPAPPPQMKPQRPPAPPPQVKPQPRPAPPPQVKPQRPPSPPPAARPAPPPSVNRPPPVHAAPPPPPRRPAPPAARPAPPPHPPAAARPAPPRPPAAKKPPPSNKPDDKK
jgi:Family of unknown function (DUF6600)